MSLDLILKVNLKGENVQAHLHSQQSKTRAICDFKQLQHPLSYLIM
jgi:hypothetical protein